MFLIISVTVTVGRPGLVLTEAGTEFAPLARLGEDEARPLPVDEPEHLDVISGGDRRQSELGQNRLQLESDVLAQIGENRQFSDCHLACNVFCYIEIH